MRILVSAASKHGATAEIAKTIERALQAHGLTVDRVAPDEVTTLDPYDSVVLGSAIYTGHWLAPAKRLVERYGAALRERPVWLFSSGPLGDPPTPDETPVDVPELLTATGAREHRIFTGRLERETLGLVERAMVRVVHAPLGDFRDWQAVEDWAATIGAELRDASRQASPTEVVR